MFTNPSFDDLISPRTLVFRNHKLEKYYRDSQHSGYLHQFPRLYLVLLPIAISAFSNSYITYTFFAAKQYKQAWPGLVANGLFIFGLIIELLLDLSKKLQVIKTVPLGLCVFFGSAWVNCAANPIPAMRPA